MGTWHTRGLRGSTLEDMVNRTNERYLEQELALIQKIPTPITPVRMDKEHRQITLAYFEQRSTVDYIGAVQGIPVCFDAKECNADTFPLQNIHEHQIIFMENLEKQQGISFLLIYYTARNEMYYMRFEEVAKFWNRAMFPIMDANNRVIGFGGRVMGEGEPKYLNSPETMIFDKSRNLYGLNFARVSRRPHILLCEGYMDVRAGL